MIKKIIYTTPLILFALILSIQGRKNQETDQANTTIKTQAIKSPSHFKQKNLVLKKTESNIEIPTSASEKVIQVERLKSNFEKLYSISSNVFFERSFNENMQLLSENEDNMKIAVETIIDLDQAIKNFGKDQARARVYSIELIKFRSLHNNPELITQVIKQLSVNLCNLENKKKGQDQDLIDLLIVYMSINTDDIYNNGEMDLDSLGYCKKNNNLFAQGVFEGTAKKISDQKIKKLINKIFNIEYLI